MYAPRFRAALAHRAGRIAVGGHMPIQEAEVDALLTGLPPPPSPPSPPSPPPPPTCQSSGLRGDAPGFKRCEPFCRAKRTRRGTTSSAQVLRLRIR